MSQTHDVLFPAENGDDVQVTITPHASGTMKELMARGGKFDPISVSATKVQGRIESAQPVQGQMLTAINTSPYRVAFKVPGFGSFHAEDESITHIALPKTTGTHALSEVEGAVVPIGAAVAAHTFAKDELNSHVTELPTAKEREYNPGHAHVDIASPIHSYLAATGVMDTKTKALDTSYEPEINDDGDKLMYPKRDIDRAKEAILADKQAVNPVDLTKLTPEFSIMAPDGVDPAKEYPGSKKYDIGLKAHLVYGTPAPLGPEAELEDEEAPEEVDDYAEA